MTESGHSRGERYTAALANRDAEGWDGRGVARDHQNRNGQNERNAARCNGSRAPSAPNRERTCARQIASLVSICLGADVAAEGVSGS